tara:strand:+ start:4383 stop:5651 length:1269 start_codon:yes stop_codon:yes gene_type:complete
VKKSILKKIINIIYQKKLFLFEFLIFLPSSIILIILTRIVQNFKGIKFLPVNFSRIGNIYPLYWYFRVNEQINFDKGFINFFFIEDKYKHNKTWLKLWSKKINLLPFSKIWKNYFFLSKYFPGHNKIKIIQYNEFFHNLYLSKKKQKDVINFKKYLVKISNMKKDLLKFSENEITKGREYLHSVGTKEFSYICFHARDKSYLKDYDNTKDWSYHDFRDSNIDNYLNVINKLSDKGHHCLRMGSKVEKKIPSQNPKIIDYANSSSQSDFLDIYLGSKCLMAVYSESGISVIPEVFNRPIVYVNWPALNFSCFNSNSLVIPKKFFSKKKNRFLSITEILELNFEESFRGEKLREMEIDLIENTPQEISEAVIENYKRINGDWKDDQEGLDLQRKFWDIFKFNYIKSSSFRIGTDYLKKYSQLIQ